MRGHEAITALSLWHPCLSLLVHPVCVNLVPLPVGFQPWLVLEPWLGSTWLDG